nr:MAG: hypothetical protein [Bacteriophage sp.]
MDKLERDEQAMYDLMLATITHLTKQLHMMVISVVLIIALALGTICALMWDNNRFKNELAELLSTEEIVTTTETTQSVDGEGKINNVDGNQYNDSATHNDNGGN